MPKGVYKHRKKEEPQFIQDEVAALYLNKVLVKNILYTCKITWPMLKKILRKKNIKMRSKHADNGQLDLFLKE